MNPHYIPVIGMMLLLLLIGVFGIHDGYSQNSVTVGIISGISLGLIPMGWNELMTIKEEDVNHE